MATLAEATAAPQEFEYKGETLLLYPLRLVDIGQLDRWLRSEFQRTAFETLDGMEMPEVERRKREGIALETAQRITLWHDDTRRGLVASLPMLTRIAWLSLRRGGDALDLAGAEAMFGNDLETLVNIFDIVFHISWPELASRADAEVGQQAKGEAAEPEGAKAANPTSPTGRTSTSDSPS